MSAPSLHRSTPGAPVRQVHLGLGNFFRAHQAWYTAESPDAGDWGIAAFAGRSRGVVDELAAQDGLYTLITRSADGDDLQAVPTLSAVHPGTDHDAYLRYLADTQVALVTTTVTEAGYRRGRDGALDTSDPAVVTDIAALRGGQAASVSTTPARLVAGLLARRAAGAGPISIVPCDNLPDNGAVVARVVGDLASAVEPSLAAWIDGNVGFVSTVVDRITPRATDADRELVRDRTGVLDTSPVVTEPFHEWILSGEFVAGRPSWEKAGAVLVDDVTAFENRKLWLLNGAHSLLAYSGLVRGHRTIADAASDPSLAEWVREWWALAATYLPFDVTDYCAALLTRFTNPRIRHELRQVGTDGSQKLPVRIPPVLHSERAAGRLPLAAARVLAAYVAALRVLPEPPPDPRLAELIAAGRTEPLPDAVRQVLVVIDPASAGDDELCDAIARLAEEVAGR